MYCSQKVNIKYSCAKSHHENQNLRRPKPITTQCLYCIALKEVTWSILPLRINQAEDKIDNRCLSGGGRSFVCRDWVASSRPTQTSQYAVWTCREVPVHLLAAGLALEQDTQLLTTSPYTHVYIQVLFVHRVLI